MAKRLRSEQEVEPKQDKASLWWIDYQELVFFMILSRLPIKDIFNCRLVCWAWSKWALHDLVWSRHIERITSFYPYFKSEFVDKSPVQVVSKGRFVKFDVPKKRRRPRGKKKVASKRTQELPKSGHWYAVKSFLKDKFGIKKAQIIMALGNCSMKQEMRSVSRFGHRSWHSWDHLLRMCWIFNVESNVFKECLLYFSRGRHQKLSVG